MREPHPDDTFHVLKELEQMDSSTQRELAQHYGFSLGKMNFILKALIKKGIIKMVNFSHSSEKTKYRYILTPVGIKAKYRLAQQFLTRKELEYEKIQQELSEIKQFLQKTKD